jgi:hypothetical protein
MDTNDENVTCQNERKYFLEEFKEAQEIQSIIASITTIYDNQVAVEIALERFQCKYL